MGQEKPQKTSDIVENIDDKFDFSGSSIADSTSVQTYSKKGHPELSEEQAQTDSTKYIPTPSKRREEIRGRTIASWGLARRKISRELLLILEKAFFNTHEAVFAFHIEEFTKKIEDKIADFRDIPHEDIFPGILQVICDLLYGENFSLIQENDQNGEARTKVISETLKMLSQKEVLNLEDYETVIQKSIKAGLKV